MSARKKSSLFSSPNFKEFIMIFLAIASVSLLGMEVVIQFNLATVQWLNTLDLIISVAFFGDFFLHRHLSPEKKRFFSRHWWELLSAFPIVSPFTIPLLSIKILSAISLLQVLRLARLVIRIRILLEASSEFTRHAYLIYVTTITSIVLISGASGFYLFEFGNNPNVHSFGDAIWWAIVTSTTIGYGDIYPTTTGGRVVAVIVMFIGIAALGTFIASIESLLQSRRNLSKK